MPGVGAALVADDDVVLLGEQVDDFAFGLVAPLQSNDTGARHAVCSSTNEDLRRLLATDSSRRATARLYLNARGSNTAENGPDFGEKFALVGTRRPAAASNWRATSHRDPIAGAAAMASLRWQPIALLFAAWTLTGHAATAHGQGMLVDARPDHGFRLPRPIMPPHPTLAVSSYQIESLEVDAKLSDSVARVQVSQTFKNTGSRPDRSLLHLPPSLRRRHRPADSPGRRQGVPRQAASKEEARRRYEEIVRTNRDPALLEWVGTGMFQTSVFPDPRWGKRAPSPSATPSSAVSSAGLTDFLFPLSTAKYTDAGC